MKTYEYHSLLSQMNIFYFIMQLTYLGVNYVNLILILCQRILPMRTEQNSNHTFIIVTIKMFCYKADYPKRD